MSLNNLSATNISGALIDAGDFVINKRLVSNNQILYYTDPVTSIKTGYVWKGTLPHITSTNNPNTDGGISDTAWVPVIYSKLKEKMETEGLTLDWNAHLPTVEVAYGLTKNSLKMWKSGTTATSDDYWLYTDGTVWNGVGVLGSTPETSTGFEKITPNFNASIKTYSASATDGQTVFNIPFTFSTITVFVNGSIKLPGLNYTVSGNTVTFTTELEAGDLLYVFIGNPNISTNDKLNRIYTANAMQGQTTIQVPYDFSTAIVYINGVMQNPTTAYSIGADKIITFSEELYQNDEIVIMLGDIIIQSDEYLLKSDISSPDGFTNIGQVDSILELTSITSSDKSRILVKGYYSGSNYGGGEFYYDSTKKDINNGVTIFNGWIRIIKNSTLSTDDAGLISNSGIDSSEKLQTLMDISQDGYTIKIRGYHITNKPIRIENKNDIVIDGYGGYISSKELRDQYKVLYYASSNSSVMMTGLLSAFKCYNITIKGLFLQGCVKMSTTYNPDGTVVGEEHGLFLRSCDGGSIYDCRISNIFGYGCLGWFQSNMKFYNNYVYNIIRESGVNIISGGSYAKIYGNVFKNIGLYGVEVEGHPYLNGMDYIDVYGNTIEDCRFGIPVIDKCLNANIFGNTIKRCHTGITSYRTYNYNVESIKFSNNIITGCIRGVFANTSRNTDYTSNKIDINGIPEYIYTSSFNNIYKIDSTNRNIFWAPYNSEFASLIGKNISIDDQDYNIVSTVWDSTIIGYPKDLSTDPDGLLKVTLNKPLPIELDNTIPLAKTNNWSSTLGYQSNGNIYESFFNGNIILGYSTGLYSSTTLNSNDTGIHETISDNKILKCNTWLLSNSNYGFRLIDRNEYGENSDIILGSWTGNFWNDVGMRNSFKITLPPRVTNNKLLQPSFYSPKNYNAIGIKISITDWSSTGTLQFSLNGDIVVGSGTYTSGSNEVILLYTKMNIKKGNNIIQINSSNNDLLYSILSIDILIP